MKKIKGVYVSSATEFSIGTGGTMRQTSKLIDYSEKELPKGIMEIPAGYKKTDFPGMPGQR
jgi:hypothetical protein